MIADWESTYGPDASSEYAGKSYWLATENWAGQNYPTNRHFYNAMCRFSNGYVPLFGVLGKDNEVFYGGNSRDEAMAALPLAIESFPVEEGGPDGGH